MKKTKKRRGTVLAVLLLLIGLGVMLFPTMSDLYYRWEAEREIAQYNQVTASAKGEDYSELWAAAEEYNRRLAAHAADPSETSPELDADISQYLNPLGNGMMGYIDIPKINVHLPIYQGTEERALQAGAGYWLGTSLPTGGVSTHCVLTAHNGLIKAKMFTDIDQLVVGDTFTITVLDRVMTYEVDQILTTLPNELEPLRIVEGQDYVTLYTCTPYGVNTHRLLVRGHRIATPEEQQSGALEQLTGGTGAWWIAIPLLLLLLILIFVIRLLLRKRGQNRNRKNPAEREDPVDEPKA